MLGKQVERRGEEVLPRTSWTAELSRLECFICHKGTPLIPSRSQPDALLALRG